MLHYGWEKYTTILFFQLATSYLYINSNKKGHFYFWNTVTEDVTIHGQEEDSDGGMTHVKPDARPPWGHADLDNCFYVSIHKQKKCCKGGSFLQ